MHPTLGRQLRKAGLSRDALPTDPGAWRKFTDLVNKAYKEADQGRAMIERAMGLSSEEMRVLLAEALELNGALRESQSVLEGLRQEASRARAAAESANISKSRFLANMSHEIRTPMTAILGFADLLEEATDETRREYVRTIRNNGEHLLTIINGILDLSKIEAGSMALESVPCSPAKIVRRVAELLGPRATAKGLELSVVVEAGVPEAILSDPTRVRQIVLNLIGNAIKFTTEGGVKATVSFIPGPDSAVDIAVSDTGIGMTPEQVGRLFAPFTQADLSTTRRYGGTGLGLAVSKQLAGLLGGSLTPLCTPDEGCTFTLRLPAIVPQGEAGSEEPEAGQGAAPDTGLLKGARILLAEDGPDNQRLIGHHLGRAGALVEVAANGRIAVDRVAESGSFDLILMDMHMPELDGYAATQLLRERGYTGPIMALTANAMAGDRAACLRAGCDDYVSKPIDAKQLLESCARCCRRTGAAA